MNKDLKQTLSLILANQSLIMQNMYEINSNDELLDQGINQTKLAVVKLTKEDKIISEECGNADLNNVFLWWNIQEGLQPHRKIAPHISSIKVALKVEGIEEIKRAIVNYRDVVCDDDYFFNYKWSLKDFLNRGLLKFLDSADPLNNHKANNGRKETTKSSVGVEEEFDKFNAVFEKKSQ